MPCVGWCGGALGGDKVLPEISREPQGGGAGQGVGGRGAPERWADGEAAQMTSMFNGDGVAPVVVDECGGVL
jgi:hypothetical protein